MSTTKKDPNDAVKMTSGLDDQMQADLDEVMRKYDRESNTRVWEGWQRWVVGILMVAFSLYCIGMTLFFSGLPETRLAAFLAMIVFIGFLTYPVKKGHVKVNFMPWYDIVLMLVGTACFLYFAFNALPIIKLATRIQTHHVIIGAIGILVLIELCRRCVGVPILCVLGALLVYTFYNQLSYNPSLYQALKNVVYKLFYTTNGVIGTPINVCYTYIVLFIIFGAFLERTGIANFFIAFANRLAGWSAGGPAKVAVISSALCGMVSGSSVGNTVTTGSVTIPMMKKTGYKPEFAGAVEAAASTGGQILPPVMGSGAFLMVAFTEQKYIAIVIAAVIPALLYYWGCAVAVMSQTEIAHVTLMDPKDIPKSREVMKDGWIYLLIIAVLLYCLLVAQYSPLYSALWATCAVPVVMLFDKKKRFTLKTIPSAMVKSGFSAMSIVIGCACAGIVVGMVSITGIGVIFGDMMIQAAHGLLFPSLLFTAITCIVLGMGLPTTAAYVIAASILAPSLIKLGLAPLTAHLFVFYFACLSAITPPVALAAYAGAGIAKTNPMTTAVEACKLGFAGFMVPFAFCYNPAMMMQGSVGEIISVAISAIIGVAIMSAGFQGWLLWKLNWLERIVFIAGGLLMFIPGTLTDIAGLVIAVALLLVNVKKWEKGPKFIMDKHKAKQEQK